MNEVCEFVKEYIKGDSIERKHGIIMLNNDEQLFSTLREEHEYVIECLKKIEEVSAITNIREGKFDTHLADLVITDNKIVKISITVYTDSRSYDYWAIEVETIIANT
jgi:hypothetical protein